MSASTRTFCLGSDDTVYVLPHTQYQAMLGDPAAHPILRFANQSVRCAATVVEVQDGERIRVDWISYFVMKFDGRGVLDREAHLRAFVDRNSEANQAIAGKASSMSEARRAVMNAAR